MKEHFLKTWPSEFEAVKTGRKRFEFRKNDRDFALGDTLVLRLWDPHGGDHGAGGYIDKKGKRITSSAGDMFADLAESLNKRVVYVLHGGQHGVPVGFCVMSLEDA